MTEEDTEPKTDKEEKYLYWRFHLKSLLCTWSPSIQDLDRMGWCSQRRQKNYHFFAQNRKNQQILQKEPEPPV